MVGDIWSSLLVLLGAHGGSAAGGSSVQIRLDLFRNGFALFRENYALPLGPGASAIGRIGPNGFSIGSPVSLHNFWLETAIDGGLVMLFGLMTWMTFLVAALVQRYHREASQSLKRLYLCTSVALIGFVPAAVTASSVIYFFPMWMLLGFAVALLNLASFAATPNRQLS